MKTEGGGVTGEESAVERQNEALNMIFERLDCLGDEILVFSELEEVENGLVRSILEESSS